MYIPQNVGHIVEASIFCGHKNVVSNLNLACYALLQINPHGYDHIAP